MECPQRHASYSPGVSHVLLKKTESKEYNMGALLVTGLKLYEGSLNEAFWDL